MKRKRRKKQNMSDSEQSYFRLRKESPCPTGTRVIKSKKKEQSKKACRNWRYTDE